MQEIHVDSSRDEVCVCVCPHVIHACVKRMGCRTAEGTRRGKKPRTNARHSSREAWAQEQPGQAQDALEKRFCGSQCLRAGKAAFSGR